MKKNKIVFLSLMVLSLFVGCKQPEPVMITVTLDPNGGVGEKNTLTAEEGYSMPLPENKYTRENYSFGGWSKASDSTIVAYADKAEYTFTEDETLYAIWNKLDLGAAPATIKMEEKDGSITITWDKVTAATKYIIYSASVNDSAKAKEEVSLETSVMKKMSTVTETATSYTYKIAVIGSGLHYYWIKAANEEKTTDFSKVVIFNKDNLQPVKDLTVTKSAKIKNKVTFTWDGNNTLSLPQYALYQGKTDDFSKATLRTKNSSKGQEITLNESGTYYFWIKTSNFGSTEGIASAESASVKIDFTYEALVSPAITDATKTGNNVKITWEDTGAACYLVYYVYEKDLITSNKTFKDAKLLNCFYGRRTGTIENIEAGCLYVWVVAADDDPSVVADTKKSKEADVPFVKVYL